MRIVTHSFISFMKKKKKDGNGSISANELGSIMRKMGIDASDAELKVRPIARNSVTETRSDHKYLIGHDSRDRR